jgi:hypothetical protein
VAPNADVSVRPGLARDPLDDLVAVQRMTSVEEVELPAGTARAADGHVHGRIVGDPLAPSFASGESAARIAVHLQQCRPRTRPRQLDVGGEKDTVAHLYVCIGDRGSG